MHGNRLCFGKARKDSIPDAQCPASLDVEGRAVLTPTVEQDWPPSPEELFNTGETAPAKRMLVGQSQIDEYEREKNTRRCLDSNGAQGSLSSGSTEALIKQQQN